MPRPTTLQTLDLFCHSARFARSVSAVIRATGITRTARLAAVTALAALGFFSALAANPAFAAEDAHSVGPGAGTLSNPDDRGSCEFTFMNADETYENGYCWQYGGNLPPYYGAFAECYDFQMEVCSILLDLTQTGAQISQVLDAYVWDDDNDLPGAVLCVETGVNPGPIAFWPSLSRHLIDIQNCDTTGPFWVGFWGNWPESTCGWFVGADTDGFGGCPVSNNAPGIGFPTGWTDVSLVWGPTQALGIGVEGNSSDAPFGACCEVDGTCTVRTETTCQFEYLGDGVPCEPNPCEQPPAGACCPTDSGFCYFVSSYRCDELGGVYLGDDIPCNPNPCPQPVGACCFADGNCIVLTADLCAENDGGFNGPDTDCDPNPCPQLIGACCLPTGDCLILPYFDCSADGGTFQGEGVSCIEGLCLDPCITPSPERQGRFTPAPNANPFESGITTSAGPNVDGTLLLHANTSLVYTDSDAYCGSSALDVCEDATTRVDTEEITIVHVLASFSESSSPRVAGLSFGISYGECVGIADWSACADFELAMENWPDAGSGTAVIWNDAQTSTLFEAYWFAAYGTVSSPGLISLIPHATQGATFADDSIPAVLDGIEALGQFGFYRNGGPACGDGLPLGACCLIETGNCYLVLEEVCAQIGGQFLGVGEICDPNPCPQPVPGACCFPDGNCIVLTSHNCESANGAFQGEGTGCNPNPCPQLPEGACCFENGVCLIRNEVECGQIEGQYWGDDTVCEPNPCPQPPSGACCFENGSCELLTEFLCHNGEWEGEDTVCEPNPCPQPPIGACCLTDGGCVVVYVVDCRREDGLYLGDGVLCDPDPCPEPYGACCVGGDCVSVDEEECDALGGDFAGYWTDCGTGLCESEGGCCMADGTCEVLREFLCQGDYQGDGTVCDPNPCSVPTGACCLSDGSCINASESECNASGGDYQGEGTSCDPNPCSQPQGACCFADGSCVVTTDADCGGEFLGNGTSCDPNPCDAPTGACCLGDGDCVVVTAQVCTELVGSYQGDGVECDPNPCESSPTIETSWGEIKNRYRHSGR